MRVILFATGEDLRPPQTSGLFKGHRRLQKKNKRRVVAAIHACAKKQHQVVALCGSCHARTGVKASLQLRPPQPPRFLKAIDGCKEKEQASGFVLALKEGCADHSVCNWGGLRTPQPPRFLKAIDACKKRTSVGLSPPSMLALKKEHQVVALWIIYVCAKGKLHADHFVCKWGRLRPSMLARKNGRQVVAAIHACDE